eukprot:440889_1
MLCSNCTVWYNKPKLELLSSGFINNDLKKSFPIDLIQIITHFITLDNLKEASLLWNKPQVTIQMVSEFMEMLPHRQKEKIFARHATISATGLYIARNKLLHTLHSFTALCIKIKDRTGVPPSRHDIENKLIPFATHIKTRIKNQNGMSLQQFNHDLHWWILEPVSGICQVTFSMSNQIYELRKELAQTKRENLQYKKQNVMEKEQEIVRLQKENKALENNKMDTIVTLANSVEQLRETVVVLSKQVEILKNKN